MMELSKTRIVVRLSLSQYNRNTKHQFSDYPGSRGGFQALAEEIATEETTTNEDPMEIACELAIGKTENQFRQAISLHPKFISNPLLPLAKAGALTAALMKEGKLVEVQEGAKKVYKKP